MKIKIIICQLRSDIQTRSLFSLFYADELFKSLRICKTNLPLEKSFPSSTSPCAPFSPISLKNTLDGVPHLDSEPVVTSTKYNTPKKTNSVAKCKFKIFQNATTTNRQSAHDRVMYGLLQIVLAFYISFFYLENGTPVPYIMI